MEQRTGFKTTVQAPRTIKMINLWFCKTEATAKAIYQSIIRAIETKYECTMSKTNIGSIKYVCFGKKLAMLL